MDLFTRIWFFIFTLGGLLKLPKQEVSVAQSPETNSVNKLDSNGSLKDLNEANNILKEADRRTAAQLASEIVECEKVTATLVSRMNLAYQQLGEFRKKYGYSFSKNIEYIAASVWQIESYLKEAKNFLKRSEISETRSCLRSAKEDIIKKEKYIEDINTLLAKDGHKLIIEVIENDIKSAQESIVKIEPLIAKIPNIFKFTVTTFKKTQIKFFNDFEQYRAITDTNIDLLKFLNNFSHWKNVFLGIIDSINNSEKQKQNFTNIVDVEKEFNKAIPVKTVLLIGKAEEMLANKGYGQICALAQINCLDESPKYTEYLIYLYNELELLRQYVTNNPTIDWPIAFKLINNYIAKISQ